MWLGQVTYYPGLYTKFSKITLFVFFSLLYRHSLTLTVLENGHKALV